MEFKDKVVLVIGASGFIGSHLVQMLAEKGTKHLIATGLHDNKLIRDNFPKVTFIRWDIRKPFSANKTIDHIKKIDWIFHLGAITDINYCEKYPDIAYEVNTSSIKNIFELGEKYSFNNFVYLSTLGVYGNPEYLPIDENHPKRPQNIYTKSKLECEELVLDYKRKNNGYINIVRSFNAYGPRQNSSMVIPKIITQALKSNNIILANINTSRDFIYVTDLVEGLISVAYHNKSDIYNLGSGSEIYINELINSISIFLNKELNVICKTTEKQFVCRSQANISKSISELHWKPRVSLKKGLLKTINYYRKELGE